MRLHLCCSLMVFFLAIKTLAADDPPTFSSPPSGPRLARFWGQADYLYWWIARPQTPPLVTTGPQASGGFLDDPRTQVLFGGRPDFGPFYGGRVTLGFWFDPEQRCGIEGSYFLLSQGRIPFSADSNGEPLLARPFISATNGLPAVEQVANLADPNNPGLIPLAGRVAVDMTSTFQGADLNLRFFCYQAASCPLRIDFLAGVRYLDLGEGLRIQEDLAVPDAAVALSGSRFLIADEFNTSNRFYGGQIGARVELASRRHSVGLVAKVALGATTQRVQINGSSTIDDPINPPIITRPGGLLAMPSNMGTYQRSVFSVTPEVGINLGFKISEQIVLRAGYSALYWSNVVRPGDQIDLRVNQNLLPAAGIGTGPFRPEFRFQGTDFWVHGASVGLELLFNSPHARK